MPPISYQSESKPVITPVFLSFSFFLFPFSFYLLCYYIHHLLFELNLKREEEEEEEDDDDDDDDDDICTINPEGGTADRGPGRRRR